MPSVAESTMWFVRVTKSHAESIDLVNSFVMMRSPDRLLCIGHVGDKTEKEHIHMALKLQKSCQKQSVDVAIKKLFAVSGADYSSKVWDGREDACSYMFHDDNYKLICSKGFTTEDLERFKAAHAKVAEVVEINKERGAKRVVDRVVKYYRDQQCIPTRERICGHFLRMIRDGEMYEPGDYGLKKYVEEVLCKVQTDDTWGIYAADRINRLYEKSNY